MKYIIIDDNQEFANKLGRKLNDMQVCKELQFFIPLKDDDIKLCELADKIILSVASGEPKNELDEKAESESKNSESDILFINVNCAFKGTKRLDQKGVELLIWLRIKGLINHVVLYSFETMHTLLNREPKHLLATSNGTTSIQLPTDYKILNLIELSRNKAGEDNLKATLKPISDIVQFRHIYANIWGLARLVGVFNELNPQTPFQRSIEENELGNINYRVSKYLFEGQKDIINDTEKKSIYALQQNIYTNKSKKSILYIDDKAEDGWFDFLKKLMPANVILNYLKPEPTETENTLYNTFCEKFKEGNYDFIISDLRLLPSEEQETDYNNFISVKFMKQVMNKEKFPKLKFALFTASNQLANYKNMLEKSNKYSPNAIFIKEGFDFQYSKQHRYKNYINLLLFIKQILKDKYKSIAAGVDQADIKEEKIIDGFIEHLLYNTWQPRISALQNELEGYTDIIPDTNMFLVEKPLIPLSDNKKVRITYPVWKELERNSTINSEKSKDFLGEYFKTNIDPSTIDEASISKRSKEKIDRNPKDFKADDYFIEILTYYTSKENAEVVFLTNDLLPKETDTDGKSPSQKVEYWAENSNVKNIRIGTLFGGKLDIIYPKIKKGGSSGGKRHTEKKTFQKGKDSVALKLTDTKTPKSNIEIKWHDTELDMNSWLLRFKIGIKDVTINIGKNNRMGFKPIFETLKKSDQMMGLNKNKDGSYTIVGLQNAIQWAKKRNAKNGNL